MSFSAPKISVFHIGVQLNVPLWHNEFDTVWWGDRPIPGASGFALWLSALDDGAGTLRCFYYTPGKIRFSSTVYPTGEWENYDFALSSYGFCALHSSFGNVIFCVKDTGYTKAIEYMTLENTNPVIVSENTSIKFNPTACECDGQIYIYYAAHDASLHYNHGGLQFWGGDAKIDNVKLAYSPSAVALDGRQFVFHQGGGGYDGDHSLWVHQIINGVAHYSKRLHTDCMDHSPSAVVYNDLIYVYFQRRTELYYTIFDGVRASNVFQVPNTGINLEGGLSAVVTTCL